ncbi:hypothetical protein AB0J82_04600 [Asanoa sp. NPDC049518]|uniref:hypothetical protein n=1 Tax=unclassified Asanoa TaxID=2685164 RepID=UPI003423D243
MVGDEWVYRLRDNSASERVRIVAVTTKKTSTRVDVAFVDDPDRRQENVPAARLRFLWNEVASFDELMANWQRIDNADLDDTEQACIEEIFELLIPEDVATWVHRPVEFATAIKDTAQLTKIIRVPTDEILAGLDWFHHEGADIASPAAALLIAEAACRAHPQPVLDLVIEQEKKSRHKCKNGGERLSIDTGKQESTSPEWEYYWYRRLDRPRHELLRQWCGRRAVTAHERMLAAEAENQRLDVLVTDLIKALERAGDETMARYYAEQHERDRITPWTARPTIDRPLDPSEIPVREVRVRRWWAH